jgi:hypothetical protein
MYCDNADAACGSDFLDVDREGQQNKSIGHEFKSLNGSASSFLRLDAHSIAQLQQRIERDRQEQELRDRAAKHAVNATPSHASRWPRPPTILPAPPGLKDSSVAKGEGGKLRAPDASICGVAINGETCEFAPVARCSALACGTPVCDRHCGACVYCGMHLCETCFPTHVSGCRLNPKVVLAAAAAKKRADALPPASPDICELDQKGKPCAKVAVAECTSDKCGRMMCARHLRACAYCHIELCKICINAHLEVCPMDLDAVRLREEAAEKKK